MSGNRHWLDRRSNVKSPSQRQRLREKRWHWNAAGSMINPPSTLNIQWHHDHYQKQHIKQERKQLTLYRYRLGGWLTVQWQSRWANVENAEAASCWDSRMEVKWVIKRDVHKHDLADDRRRYTSFSARTDSDRRLAHFFVFTNTCHKEFTMS